MDSQLCEILDQLFTFTFSIDEELAVSRISKRLKAQLPEIKDRSHFLETFECHRPAGIHSFTDLETSDQSMFLLISRDKKLALKGQLIRLIDSHAYQFVGMPWLAWMNEKAPETKLKLGDFPKLDSQMDQEFYFTSQQSMVRDLEALNEKLMIAEGEAKEASRVQSDLFAIMSHEMRTPLNGVISALSLISDEDSSLEKNKLISIANESANNLLSVINYTLDYSKIDAGRMTLQEQDFSLSALIESVVTVTESRAKEKKLTVTSRLDIDTSESVRGDSEKLRQVLINIVGNAIKFTDEGEVSISVSKDGSNSMYCFTIEDTGAGIDSADLEKIFDPFWGKATGSSGISTGLGLNIVKRLVEIMAGNITAISTQGHGTTFQVFIPLSSDAHTEGTLAVEERRTQQYQLAMPNSFSGKVLLVDDNQTNLMLGKMMLEKHGVSVRTASNGQEAVEIARDITFDLVLMDISMPIMDGVTATKEINNRENPPPVVALTANVRDELIEKYRADGFQGYLRKPLGSQALLTELNLWLKPNPMSLGVTIDSEKDLSKTSILEALWSQIGEENFQRVRELFLEETERRVNVLLGAWVRRDLEAMRKEAHTISSSVASFGCEDLAWRLKQIEQASSENDVREIIKYMKDIESVSTDSLKAVTSFSVTEEV
ncbi:MAG: response regulator [Pseudomonadales bacterium]|nr:response regulator [Pseudomonadales bacterium]MBO6563891.1 response regulator [Pseudomonadales bacterium]MBO6596380.1 response regulator [Pseudomonadales bacterium]MBO6658243.1 response regulator [Pseudomonadales bacterium]MBO6822860.1 response regulator [Pseudomonadales bacterium]